MTKQRIEPTRLLPQAVELEEAVLASVLIDKDTHHTVFEILTEDCFYLDEHRIVYKAIQDLVSDNKPVDIMTVSQHLMVNGLLEKVGGIRFITNLVDRIGSTAHVEEHARIVYEAYMRRKIIQVSSNIIAQASEGVDAFKLSIEAEKELKQFNEIVGDRGNTVETLLEDIFNQKPRTAINVPAIRDAGLCYTGGNFWVLAARPGMGKSALMCEVSREQLNEGKPMLVFSLEMSAKELFVRMVASECDVDMQTIENNRMDEAEQRRYNFAYERMKKWKLHIEDNIFKIDKIKAVARKYKAKYPHLEMIAIDYLQIVDSGLKTSNRNDQVGYISRTCKMIAKELEVTVLGLAQLSRDVEKRANKRPMLSDLRESGSIEQDADMVTFLYRPAYYGETTDETGKDISKQLEFIVAKFRGGKIGNGFADIELSKNKLIESNEYAHLIKSGESQINNFRTPLSEFDTF